MTLGPALVIVLSFCQLIDAKVTFPVDIAMILMPDKHDRRYYYNSIADKFFEHYEMGYDKARMALVTAIVPGDEADTTDWVLLPPTADVNLIKNKLEVWRAANDVNPVKDYVAALRALPTHVFARSGNRAKVVLIVFATGPPQDKVNELIDTAKQLRDGGCFIYVILRPNEWRYLKEAQAKEITGSAERVIKYVSDSYKETVADKLGEKFTQMDQDIANRPPPPTEPPPPAPEPPETTTGGAHVSPSLQLTCCLLIGLALAPFGLVIVLI